MRSFKGHRTQLEAFLEGSVEGLQVVKLAETTDFLDRFICADKQMARITQPALLHVLLRGGFQLGSKQCMKAGGADAAAAAHVGDRQIPSGMGLDLIEQRLEVRAVGRLFLLKPGMVGMPAQATVSVIAQYGVVELLNVKRRQHLVGKGENLFRVLEVDKMRRVPPGTAAAFEPEDKTLVVGIRCLAREGAVAGKVPEQSAAPGLLPASVHPVVDRAAADQLQVFGALRYLFGTIHTFSGCSIPDHLEKLHGDTLPVYAGFVNS